MEKYFQRDQQNCFVTLQHVEPTENGNPTYSASTEVTMEYRVIRAQPLEGQSYVVSDLQPPKSTNRDGSARVR